MKVEGGTPHTFSSYCFGTTTKNTQKINKIAELQENFKKHVERCLIRNLESIVRFQSSKTSKLC